MFWKQTQMMRKNSARKKFRIGLEDRIKSLANLETLINSLKTRVAGGRGCRGAMIPAKITSEPPDLQNGLQAPQNRLRASRYASDSQPFSLHAPHFGLQLKIFGYYIHQKLFFQKIST